MTTTLKRFNYLSLINNHRLHNSTILSCRFQPATSFLNSGFRYFQSNHFFCEFLSFIRFCSGYLWSGSSFVWLRFVFWLRILHVRRNVLKIRAFGFSFFFCRPCFRNLTLVVIHRTEQYVILIWRYIKIISASWRNTIIFSLFDLDLFCEWTTFWFYDLHLLILSVYNQFCSYTVWFTHGSV